MLRRKRQPGPKVVDPQRLHDTLAKTVADGDIVNLRLLFASFSPGRVESTERFEDAKYAYLQPGDEEKTTEAFRRASASIGRPEILEHVDTELAAKRPARLPFELVLELADNAVQLGKFTAASQAYEMLRIRRRMQQLFLENGDRALAGGDVRAGVTAYRIAVALAYDYAAFPEPLPEVPDYQKKALVLHGSYPVRPEDCVCLLPEELHLRAALDYLLGDPEVAAKLDALDKSLRLEFLRELVGQIDPYWNDFANRFQEAGAMVEKLGQDLQKAEDRESTTTALQRDLEMRMAQDMERITVRLLGREIPGGEWWQYLKELAYEHPAAVLFVARYRVGNGEFILPRIRAGSALPGQLQLAGPATQLESEQEANPRTGTGKTDSGSTS